LPRKEEIGKLALALATFGDLESPLELQTAGPKSQSMIFPKIAPEFFVLGTSEWISSVSFELDNACFWSPFS
jgi:hypothetical protein